MVLRGGGILVEMCVVTTVYAHHHTGVPIPVTDSVTDSDTVTDSVTDSDTVTDSETETGNRKPGTDSVTVTGNRGPVP
jgi:hypothetical protein